jgi:glycine C-acetyltransferase/8-amino-7-oxononanoate synthase
VERRRVNESSQELDAIAERELTSLLARGLLRRTRRVEGLAGPRQRVDGRDVVMLASSNYLDLAGHPEVIAGAREALESWGGAAGGSRLINGNLEIHERLERALARFAGCESALLFSSGYMANLGVITALAGEGDVVVSDSLNHASIVDACRLSRAQVRVFRHSDAADLERVARDLAGFRRRVLVTDGVYSMDGDVAPLRELVPIARAHDMRVVLDDAHGFGVLGERGLGSAELEGVEPDVWVGNLGKALGSFGAWVGCSARVREWLINVARTFVFTCGLPPAAAGAALAALGVLEREPQRRKLVLERAEQLRSGLRAAGWDTLRSCTQIVPAIVGDNARVMQLCEALLARGVYAQGIRYPSVPEGTARLRLTPMSSHSAAEIAGAVEILAELRPR